MVIIDTVINTLLGRLTLDPAGMHCPSWDDAFVTGRMPRSGKLPVLNLLEGQKSGFSHRRGDSLHQFMSNLAGPRGTWVRLAMQNFTSIATGGGNAAPKMQKFSLFTVGATPWTDF